MAQFKFAQARRQSMQRHLLPALASLETALEYDLALKDTLARELDSHQDWAHLRENWYFRQVLLEQAGRQQEVSSTLSLFDNSQLSCAAFF